METVRSQWLSLWALDRADFRNANFRTADDPPWTVDDMLGRGDRERRVREWTRSRTRENMANKKMHQRLKQNPQEIPEGVPDWAKPDK